MKKIENYLFGISPEGIGCIGMLLNFAVAFIVSAFAPPPPLEIQQMVESIRLPYNADDDDAAPPPAIH